MCCGRNRPAATNETLENSFSINPSAELTVQGTLKLIRQTLTREEIQRINFERKHLPIKPVTKLTG